MGLIEIGRGPAGVDTDIFIYLIEERPRFLGVIEPLFREAYRGRYSYFALGFPTFDRESTLKQ